MSRSPVVWHSHHCKLDIRALFEIEIDRLESLPRLGIDDVRVVDDRSEGNGKRNRRLRCGLRAVPQLTNSEKIKARRPKPIRTRTVVFSSANAMAKFSSVLTLYQPVQQIEEGHPSKNDN